MNASICVLVWFKNENLFSTEEEFQTKIDGYAKQSGIEVEKIKGFYSKPENKSRLRFQMTEEKVMGFLIEKAKIKELPKDKLKKIEEV